MIHELVVDGSLVNVADRVVLDFGDTPPGPVALALVLLRDGLIEAVAFRTAKGERVKLTSGAGLLVRVRDAKSLEIHVGPRELESWAAFFLRYHRDGWAEVDHLDVEGTWDTGAACDLVIKVAKARR